MLDGDTEKSLTDQNVNLQLGPTAIRHRQAEISRGLAVGLDYDK